MKNTRDRKLRRLPRSGIDLVWVAPDTELGKEGEFTAGPGVYEKRGKLYAQSYGFVNIDKKKVMRVVTIGGG